MEEEKYIEVAIRISHSDWKKMDDKDFHKKMWEPDAKVKLCVECEVLAFGRDGFISKKLEQEE